MCPPARDEAVRREQAEQLARLGRDSRPLVRAWELVEQREPVARFDVAGSHLLALAVEHVVMRRDIDDAAARLHAQASVVGIRRPAPRGGDGRDRRPLRAVPYVEHRDRLEGLHGAALAPQRDEIGRGPDRDDAVLADHQRRVGEHALVVEEDPAACKEVVGLAVVDRDEVAVGLCHAVGRARVERRGLGLRDLQHLAEHLRAGGLVETRAGRRLAHGLEHPRDADARELGRQRGLDPRHGDEAHRGEVVDLVGLRGPDRVDERALVEQVALVQRDALAQVLDAVELLRRRAADHAVDLVAVLEQQLREI